MLSEFDVIRRYFTRPAPHAVLGVGDDAALLQVSSGMELAVSTDMLVSGRHFFPDADPYDLGHKALAVNLSDMAAMGATPRWATLSLALPAIDEPWLQAFSAGFFSLADRYGVELAGGDTTAGPLNLCVQILGEVPCGRALRRDGARPGDEIWVSGCLGDAALGLAHLQGKLVLADTEVAPCLTALNHPEPRVTLGIALRGVAHSAIDVSDGLAADLGHILTHSSVGAEVDWHALPRSVVMARYPESDIAKAGLVSGGDDYELCFTAAPQRHADIVALSQTLETPLTMVGCVTAGSQLTLLNRDGSVINVDSPGFDHFK